MKQENTRPLRNSELAGREATSVAAEKEANQPLAEWFDDLLDELQEDENYWLDAAKDEVATQVCQVMERKGVKKAELARRMEKTPTYITKVLKGTTNFTLDSLVSMARALGCDLEVRFVESQSETEPCPVETAQVEIADATSDQLATAWNGVERRTVAYAYPSQNLIWEKRYKNVLPFPKSRNYREVESRELQPHETGASKTDAQEITENDRIPLAA